MCYVLYIVKNKKNKPMTTDEFRSLVNEPEAAKLAKKHRSMLLGVLDLEVATIQDVMLPRNQIQGISLDYSWDKIIRTIQKSAFSKLIVYEKNIDNITGVFSLRKANNLININLKDSDDKKKALEKIISKAYFVPETTTLHSQLIAFQKTGHDLAIVVDEYGDIQGIVTLKDIIEEIIGDFDQQLSIDKRSFIEEKENAYIIKGNVTIREINRQLNIDLPVEEAKTLSGLIINYLDELPKKNTKKVITIKNIEIEIIQVKRNAVKKARIIINNKNKN